MKATDGKLLPLAKWHLKNSAQMANFAGYSMPVSYGSIIEEHLWTRSSASLFDVSHMGQISITGTDAISALERLLPADLAALREGKMRYSFLLDQTGGILDDLIATKTDVGVDLVVNGATKQLDISHLQENLTGNVQLTHHEDRALLALQGPKSADILSALLPSTSRLSFMQSGEFTWQDADLIISRCGYTGEDGFEIAIDARHAENLANALTANEAVKPAGLGARDTLRLEAGLPLYGQDLTQEIDPISAGLGFAISKKRREQGGWFGHRAIMKILEERPKTTRVGLLIEGKRPVRAQAQIFDENEGIGMVTSGGISPSLGQPIAMGYVPESYAVSGRKLSVELRNLRLVAEVVPLPFLPHNYHRIGAR